MSQGITPTLLDSKGNDKLTMSSLIFVMVSLCTAVGSTVFGGLALGLSLGRLIMASFSLASPVVSARQRQVKARLRGFEFPVSSLKFELRFR